MPNNSSEPRQVDGQVPTVIHCENLNVSCLTIWIYVGFCVYAMNIKFATKITNLIQKIWCIMEQYGSNLDWNARRSAIDRGVWLMNEIACKRCSNSCGVILDLTDDALGQLMKIKIRHNFRRLWFPANGYVDLYGANAMLMHVVFLKTTKRNCSSVKFGISSITIT